MGVMRAVNADCTFYERILASSFMFLNVGEIYSQKQILMKLHKITDRKTVSRRT